MERKEHPVPVISASGDALEVLDAEGNPYKPDGPVKYQIIGEDGSTLKEGTLEDTNLIPLEGISTKSFRVVLENHFVLDVEGFEPPEEEATEEPIQPLDELVRPLPSGDLEEFEEYEGSFEDDAQYSETGEPSGEDSDKESEAEDGDDQSGDESEDGEDSDSEAQGEDEQSGEEADDSEKDSDESDADKSDEDPKEKDSDSEDSDDEDEKDGEETDIGDDDGGKSNDQT